MRTETAAIVIKRAEGKSYASTLRCVRDEVMAQGLGDTIRRVRESKTGDLILTVTKEQVSKDKEKISDALGKKLGKEYVRTTRKKPEGTVHIRDIEAVATMDDVQNAVLRKLGYASGTGLVEVASLRQGFAGTQNAIVHLSKEDESRLLQRRAIRIGLPKCRIMAKTQIDTCFRCWLPGHPAKSCSGPDRSKACKNCGQERL